MTEAKLGRLVVRWMRGGLWLRHPEGGLLLDAPAGVVDALGADLPRVQAVVLTGDRTRSVVGLVPLLAALEPHRLPDLPVDLRFPLGAERGAMLAETWVRGWPDRYPLTLDAEPPGSRFDVGPFEVTTLPVRSGEPVWGRGEIERVFGVGVRVEIDGVALAWVPGAAPDRMVGRLCAAVDLAVVEVGVVPWPRSEVAWRLTERDAMEACADAAEVWLPGDDGRLDRDTS